MAPLTGVMFLPAISVFLTRRYITREGFATGTYKSPLRQRG